MRRNKNQNRHANVKKKSPDFKTAFLRNYKYCTTVEAFTFQKSWTKAFQPYKMLFQCIKVFPQSFYYRCCNTTAISTEVNFDTSFNPHMEELTKCEASQNVKLVECSQWAHRVVKHSCGAQPKQSWPCWCCLLPTSLQFQVILRKHHS